MLRTLGIIVIAIFSFAVEHRAQVAVDKNDLDSFGSLVRQIEAGWNAKSGVEFAKPFAQDSDFVIINGMYVKGRPAIAEGHQRIFDTVLKVSPLKLTLERSRLLGSDVAIVHVRSELLVGEGKAINKVNARITLLLSRNRGTWEIAAFQNTMIEQ